MSDAAHRRDDAPEGTLLLPGDLTEDQLGAAPILLSVDALLIEELDGDEADAFSAALDL